MATVTVETMGSWFDSAIDNLATLVQKDALDNIRLLADGHWMRATGTYQGSSLGWFNVWAELADMYEDILGTPVLPVRPVLSTSDLLGLADHLRDDHGIPHVQAVAMANRDGACAVCEDAPVVLLPEVAEPVQPAQVPAEPVATAELTLHGCAGILICQDNLGRKFNADDVNTPLAREAKAFLAAYTGSFDWLRNVRADMVANGGTLPRAALAGVLNSMAAEGRRTAKAEAVPVPVAAAEPTESARSVPAGTYTLESVQGDNDYRPHATIRVSEPWNGADVKPGTMVLAYLSGPNNERDFTSFGFLGPDGSVRVWSRKMNPESGQPFRATAWYAVAAKALAANNPAALGFAYAQLSGRCYNCGKKLTVPASLHQGLGPDCADALGKSGERKTKRGKRAAEAVAA